MDWLTQRDWIHHFDPTWNGATIERAEFHFHRRLLERYGIVLGPGQFGSMIRQIRRKRAIRIGLRGKLGSATYAVRVPGTERIVFVVSDRLTMITALPPGKKLLIGFYAATEEARAALMVDG